MKTQVKTAEEITALRHSGKVLAEILQTLKGKLEPGMTTQTIDDLARAELQRHHVEPVFLGYDGFPASICVSVNNEIVHGIPGSRVLQDGDLVKLDFGVKHLGMITDSAITVALGKISTQHQNLIKATQEALSAGIAVARDGARVGDISAAIGAVIQKRGFYVLQSLGGHGVGHRLHEDPWIGNDGVAGTGQTLHAGMTLALEPIASVGTEELVMADDDWTCLTDDGSWACQFEHTILLTESGAEILTQL